MESCSFLFQNENADAARVLLNLGADPSSLDQQELQNASKGLQDVFVTAALSAVAASR